MPTNEQQDMLWLRFIGPSLESQSLPIYDLGTALIAVQRMIYKAHQDQEGRGTRLADDVRRSIDMQIAQHQSGSDAYGLMPIHTDNSSIRQLDSLIKYTFRALASYVDGTITEGIGDIPPDERRLGFSIYNDLVSLADRVDDKGNVTHIELTPQADLHVQSGALVINSDLRNYVKSLKNQGGPGPACELTGELTKLDFDRATAVLRVATRRNVTLRLDQVAIERLRYEAARESSITVHGHPWYRFGKDIGNYDRFDVITLTHIETPKSSP